MLGSKETYFVNGLQSYTVVMIVLEEIDSLLQQEAVMKLFWIHCMFIPSPNSF